MRKAPTNCQVEPPYPIDRMANHAVSFSIRFPDMVGHLKHPDCQAEEPHLIADCGVYHPPVSEKGNKNEHGNPD